VQLPEAGVILFSKTASGTPGPSEGFDSKAIFGSLIDAGPKHRGGAGTVEFTRRRRRGVFEQLAKGDPLVIGPDNRDPDAMRLPVARTAAVPWFILSATIGSTRDARRRHASRAGGINASSIVARRSSGSVACSPNSKP
jgi:hypothetical protein